MAKNYFTPIRLFLAFCVAFEHIFYFSDGGANSPFELGHASLGYFAVNGFFIISGYLITGSAERSGSIANFFRSRVLRIMPALIVLGLILGFILAPAIAGRAPLSNLTDGQTWYAVFTLITFIEAYPPWRDVMVSSGPYPYDITGAVWTLRYEMLAYLGTGALLALKLHKSKALVVLGCFVLTALFILDLETQKLTELNATLGSVLRFGSCYLYGAATYLLAPKLNFSWKVILPVLAAGVAILAFGVASGEALINLALTPLIFALAFAKVDLPDWFASPPDYSYGLYICHWPIYQALTHFVSPVPNGALLFFAGLPLAFAAAAISWHFIEKPSLKLKASTAIKPS